jgi:tetratricopeptide (TPR) repeat protein
VVEDDLPAAREQARKEGKLLFVEAWAPWCHTCLSMKAFVLPDPWLAPLGERVVFATIDTDREANAPFLERNAIRVWPSLFVIDPSDDTVVGYWPGSASAPELRSFVEESMRAMEDRRAKRAPDKDPSRELLVAAAAAASRQNAKAVAAYARAVASSEADWPRRSEALVGWIQALRSSRKFEACAKLGLDHVDEVRGAAMPADFALTMLLCAEELPRGAPQAQALRAATTRLEALVADPPQGASVDDRADALDILADARRSLGDARGAEQAARARLALLEEASAKAATPEIAASFDGSLASALVGAGRGGEALVLLRSREATLPNAYEPPARLASILLDLGQYPEALAASERAIAKSYGPRRLRYLKLRAAIQTRMGQRKEAIATLREELRGYDALPPGQRSDVHRAETARRLREAERAGR